MLGDVLSIYLTTKTPFEPEFDHDPSMTNNVSANILHTTWLNPEEWASARQNLASDGGAPSDSGCASN